VNNFEKFIEQISNHQHDPRQTYKPLTLQNLMPTKAQLARNAKAKRRKAQANVHVPKTDKIFYTTAEDEKRLTFCSIKGWFDEPMSGGYESARSHMLGGANNYHTWCEKDGHIYDPTPPPAMDHMGEGGHLYFKGKVVKFYRRFPTDQEKCLIDEKTLNAREQYPEGLGEYYKNPLNSRCFQNALAWQEHNTEWTLCMGSFGYKTDKRLGDPTGRMCPCPHIALDYGY